MSKSKRNILKNNMADVLIDIKSMLELPIPNIDFYRLKEYSEKLVELEHQLNSLPKVYDIQTRRVHLSSFPKKEKETFILEHENKISKGVFIPLTIRSHEIEANYDKWLLKNVCEYDEPILIFVDEIE